jgi:hypothetical protein
MFDGTPMVQTPIKSTLEKKWCKSTHGNTELGRKGNSVLKQTTPMTAPRRCAGISIRILEGLFFPEKSH